MTGLFCCANCGIDLGPFGQSHLENMEDGEQVWHCPKSEDQNND